MKQTIQEHKVHIDEYGDTVVKLENGFEARFWQRGLSQEEYIKRTIYLFELEG